MKRATDILYCQVNGCRDIDHQVILKRFSENQKRLQFTENEQSKITYIIWYQYLKPLWSYNSLKKNKAKKRTEEGKQMIFKQILNRNYS